MKKHAALSLVAAAALALSGSLMAQEAEVLEAPEDLQTTPAEVVDGMAEHPGDSWGPIGWFQRWRWSRNNPQAAEWAEKHEDAAEWVKQNKDDARKAKKSPGKVRWRKAKELREKMKMKMKMKMGERGRSEAARAAENHGRQVSAERRGQGQANRPEGRGGQGGPPEGNGGQGQANRPEGRGGQGGPPEGSDGRGQGGKGKGRGPNR